MAAQWLPELTELPDQLRGAFVTHVRFTRLGGEEEGATAVGAMRGVGPVLLDTVGDMPLTEMGSIHADLVDPLPYWDRRTSLRELQEQERVVGGEAGSVRRVPRRLRPPNGQRRPRWWCGSARSTWIGVGAPPARCCPGAEVSGSGVFLVGGGAGHVLMPHDGGPVI
ncbi:hypothetical protein ACFWP5_15340 [Streptomyces sp. NPDC058469]|uniref:hypothetical protein n=1 Tax=Streptomyces sp. NPDC058469 TaxID=3346514 RepID=UPI00364E9DAB